MCFFFFNVLICLDLELYNTVNIDNKRFPLCCISATGHQVPHKRICLIVQEVVKNTDTVSSQLNEVIFHICRSTVCVSQQLWFQNHQQNVISDKKKPNKKTQEQLEEAVWLHLHVGVFPGFAFAPFAFVNPPALSLCPDLALEQVENAKMLQKSGI